ncbi:MAG TPA: hypothetical protein VK633_02415 [Verrucomicrobiae bacterium]|nr:hypothetical protein [Verrucomicrobiae bacterium]
MNTPSGRFNLILTIFACAVVGCKTPEAKEPKEKQASILRFHLETNPDDTGRTLQVPVYRAQPMLVTIGRDAVLDEGFLKTAEVVDADEHGGHAIKVTFDDAGTRRLEALTIEHRGQHFAINASWTETRWVAAPLITKRIANGEYVFTPDATREEAERIVAGLKNVIKKLNERYTL